MDFFKEAFDGFRPHLDEDAAIKFSLNVLLMEGRLKRLVDLISQSSNVGCIEGDPGWEIEHIINSDRGLPGYASWPEWASYRAAVDTDCYQLAYPEVYLSENDFFSYVEKAIKAYLEKHPHHLDDLNDLIKLIEK